MGNLFFSHDFVQKGKLCNITNPNKIYFDNIKNLDKKVEEIKPDPSLFWDIR